MVCSLGEIRDKDVINICTGENLGYADDVQVDTQTGAVRGLILYGKPRYFGLFGAREESIITYDRIRLIGRDVILVSLEDVPHMCNMHKI